MIIKFYLSVITAFATGMVLTVHAQIPITITVNDLPQAGDNFILANDTTPNILLGSPGSTSQTWNFTGVANHYYKAAVYDSTSNTPFSSEFPLSNISTFGPAEYFGALYGGAPVGAGYDGYMFWNSDSAGLKVIGWKAIDGPYAYLPIHTNPTELLIGTPTTYGSSFTDTSRWDMLLGEVPSDVDTTWISHRFKSLSCDAWGSLNTPFGNFPDVIRIHEYVVEIDSAVATYLGTTVYKMEVYRDTINNYLYMANGIGYPLAIVHTDKFNNIKDIEYLIDTTCSVYTEIYGTISDSTGTAITEGMAYLYQFIDDFTPFEIVDSVSINSNGSYNFINVSYGEYIISASSSLTACATCIPTYYGNVNFWEDADWINTLCIDTVVADIWLNQLGALNGNGSCSGLIQLGTGKVGDPVPGLDISIEQIPGGIKALATTDQNGNYSFTGIEPGMYRLLVDYPGLPMDSTYTITVTATDTVFNDRNFTIDTTAGSGAIYVGYPLTIAEADYQDKLFHAYPNPARDQLVLEFKTNEIKNVILKDLTGRTIHEENHLTEERLIISTAFIAPGVYFIEASGINYYREVKKISILK